MSKLLEENGEEKTMKKENLNEDLQKEVEATYALLGNEERLAPNPFLFTRIEQGLEENNANGHSLFPAKVLQPVCMSLLLALALFVGVKIGSVEISATNDISETHTTEYFLNEMNQEHLEITLLNE